MSREPTDINHEAGPVRKDGKGRHRNKRVTRVKRSERRDLLRLEEDRVARWIAFVSMKWHPSDGGVMRQSTALSPDYVPAT